jgi:pimeloyl-ACP methyl ester carboxylesterase
MRRWQPIVEVPMSFTPGITRTDVSLRSGTLPYSVFGEGTPLLYLHAAGGPLISPMLEGLAAHHRIYAPTAPGFEGTPVHDAVTGIAALADLYIAFAETVIKEPFDVMGHSFGGWTALWMAIKRPDLVEQLVLEAPGGLRFGATPVPPLSPEDAIRRLYADPAKAKPFIKPPEVSAANMKAFGRYNNGILVDEPLAARLSEIKARTLILLAAKDVMIPAKTGEVLHEAIAESQLIIVEDAAHAIEIDQPEQMFTLVRTFLDHEDDIAAVGVQVG